MNPNTLILKSFSALNSVSTNLGNVMTALMNVMKLEMPKLSMII